MQSQTSTDSNSSRRDFFKTSTAAAAGVGLMSAFNTPPVHADGSAPFKIALVGCGNRGTGAVVQALNTKGSVQLYALADTFDDRLQLCLKHVERELAEEAGDDAKKTGKIDVPKERQFIGLDAYRKAIDC